MEVPEFESRADAMLARIERALDAAGIDVDVETTSGGVIEVEFPGGSKIVINRHTAAREIWVAAKSGGFHFRWDGAAWRNTRDGDELLASLSRLVSAQSGQGVILRD